MTKIRWVVVACLTLAACATTQPSTAHSEVEIRQASDHFFEVRQHGEAAAFADLFTDDGIYMVPGVEDASGRADVLELVKARFFAGRPESFEVDRREIEVLGDSAFELAWFTETTRTHIMKGRHAIVWKRVDGQWRVSRYLYSFSDALDR